MKNYSILTPEGTRDFLFEESDALRTVERTLSDMFKLRGYKKVITPTIEFFDVFNRESAGTLPENLYSMTDSYGRLLVLRPDSTLPIARIAATRLKGAALPIRLYYNQNVFTRQPKLAGHNDETNQSGIELIGARGLRADLEVITTAIESLDLCGSPDYKIEISHAGFFKALLSELNADADVLSDIYEYTETKNLVALNSVLDRLEQTETVEAVRNLPRMFGGLEVISQGEAVVHTDEGRQALSYLKEFYTSLCSLGLGNKLIIDLSLVNRNNYYTGVVFRGYTEGSGITVLSGGRYDGLIKEFGEDLPATGFGVQTDALAQAMLSRGEGKTAEPAEALVYGENGCEIDALIYMKKLNAEGVRCESSTFETLAQSLEYAKSKGIKRLYRVYDGGVEEVKA